MVYDVTKTFFCDWLLLAELKKRAEIFARFFMGH